jgi:nucleoside-diphosphate-sugar epimerase
MTSVDEQDSRLYLVTGGAGFIGSHLVRRLLAEGARVRVLDDFSSGLRERVAEFGDRIELHEDTVTDPAACARAVAGVDTVFHEAALPSVERSVVDPVGSHDVNATGTLHLLVEARKAGVRRFVYAGSSSAYGDTEVLPKHEGLPTEPRSPYAASKLIGEQYTRMQWWLHGFETVVLRYFNIFGPGQDPNSAYAAVVPLFVTAAVEGRSPRIHGDGEQTRDFTYIDNVVEANLLASKAPADKVAGEVFNVGCGDRISINRLWLEIRRLAGASVEAEHTQARQGDVRDSLADLGRARERLGYTGAVSLEEGLRRTVEAHLAGRDRAGKAVHMGVNGLARTG